MSPPSALNLTLIFRKFKSDLFRLQTHFWEWNTRWDMVIILGYILLLIQLINNNKLSWDCHTRNVSWVGQNRIVVLDKCCMVKCSCDSVHLFQIVQYVYISFSNLIYYSYDRFWVQIQHILLSKELIHQYFRMDKIMKFSSVGNCFAQFLRLFFAFWYFIKNQGTLLDFHWHYKNILLNTFFDLNSHSTRSVSVICL